MMNPILNFGGFGGLAPRKNGGFGGTEPPHKKEKKRIEACASMGCHPCWRLHGGRKHVVVRGNMAEILRKPHLMRHS